MLVNQILRSKGSEGVVTVPPSLTVAKAAELLSQKKIGARVHQPKHPHVRMALLRSKATECRTWVMRL